MNDQLDSIQINSPLFAKSRTPEVPATGAGGVSNRVGYLPKPPSGAKPPKKDDEEDDGYFRRNRVPLIVGAVVLGGLIWGFLQMPKGDSGPAKKKPETVVKITSLPPPPPPPPPKVIPPPPPKMEKKIEQPPMEKTPENKPKPSDEPPKGLGTSIKGSGPGMGLGSGRGLGGVIGGTGNGDGSARLASLYAGKAGTRIEQELRTHRKTRTASLRVEVRIWPDSTGKITKVALAGTTGDASLDEAIKSEILMGLQIQEPPPQGMKMPIVLRLNARRPSK